MEEDAAAGRAAMLEQMTFDPTRAAVCPLSLCFSTRALPFGHNTGRACQRLTKLVQPVNFDNTGRASQREREFFIDNLLVRIHFIIVMIRWTGLAPWEFGFPFPGSLTSTLLKTFRALQVRPCRACQLLGAAGTLTPRAGVCTRTVCSRCRPNLSTLCSSQFSPGALERGRLRWDCPYWSNLSTLVTPV